MNVIDDFQDDDIVKVSDIFELQNKIIKHDARKKVCKKTTRKKHSSRVQLTYRQLISLKSSKLETLVPQFRVVNRSKKI